ncbi:hypothetical protein [Glaciimonas immobilis]|uniref:Uncharacterized protein n=1 Tax=Glaciimonas immobilis TaxID=728004 RepID=A0A840RT16_9BURK|nr:hypothetical protein [Glaciimonas immobilis]KAF3997523.1 hypothetical protein HAV38_12655 [Glaciimonas immobilis]MBB5200793.1 hypothetical protein [Glaciimonas immobilis]
MAGNRKPRKGYCPKRQQMPITIRHSGSDEKALMFDAHTELLKMREGVATPESWHVLTCRLNIGNTLAHWNFNDTARDVMDTGLEALRQVYARMERTDKWGCSADELASISAALVLTDDIQMASTRRELRNAIDHVYKVAGIENSAA